jgi:hypothetical protein
MSRLDIALSNAGQNGYFCSSKKCPIDPETKEYAVFECPKCMMSYSNEGNRKRIFRDIKHVTTQNT